MTVRINVPKKQTTNIATVWCAFKLNPEASTSDIRQWLWSEGIDSDPLIKLLRKRSQLMISETGKTIAIGGYYMGPKQFTLWRKQQDMLAITTSREFSTPLREVPSHRAAPVVESFMGPHIPEPKEQAQPDYSDIGKPTDMSQKLEAVSAAFDALDISNLDIYELFQLYSIIWKSISLKIITKVDESISLPDVIELIRTQVRTVVNANIPNCSLALKSLVSKVGVFQELERKATQAYDLCDTHVDVEHLISLVEAECTAKPAIYQNRPNKYDNLDVFVEYHILKRADGIEEAKRIKITTELMRMQGLLVSAVDEDTYLRFTRIVQGVFDSPKFQQIEKANQAMLAMTAAMDKANAQKH